MHKHLYITKIISTPIPIYNYEYLGLKLMTVILTITLYLLFNIFYYYDNVLVIILYLSSICAGSYYLLETSNSYSRETFIYSSLLIIDHFKLTYTITDCEVVSCGKDVDLSNYEFENETQKSLLLHTLEFIRTHECVDTGEVCTCYDSKSNNADSIYKTVSNLSREGYFRILAHK